ncbi:DUF7146 domain-containing protein [Rubellimicrobium mesophilum]|nr:toprim domain-containing protein [Rubellimicrobium mesophilum]
MNARDLTHALKGTWFGQYGIACCPAHGDRSPSLSIKDGQDGRLLLHCFAGCSYETVRDALQDRGLLEEPWRPALPQPHVLHRPEAATPTGDRDDAARTERALALWKASGPASGTLVETYLASRGLVLPPGDVLRFHPGLKHPSGGRWPAMVARVTRGLDGAPLAIHRTFLARDGAGKAPVSPDKMMLGPTRGGVVRLAEASERVMVGEGIETCLSVMQALGGQPSWAALSTSGLRSLDLPSSVREVVILADGDDPGEAAARAAAQRWQRDGRRVRIARPLLGQDFNDLLRGNLRLTNEVRA